MRGSWFRLAIILLREALYPSSTIQNFATTSKLARRQLSPPFFAYVSLQPPAKHTRTKKGRVKRKNTIFLF